jgi:hypothetical protein
MGGAPYGAGAGAGAGAAGAGAGAPQPPPVGAGAGAGNDLVRMGADATACGVQVWMAFLILILCPPLFWGTTLSSSCFS